MGPNKSVATMSYDSDKKAYTLTQAENNGPVIFANGQSQGSTLIWTAELSMGAKKVSVRTTVKEASSRAYDFSWELLTDGGAPLEIMRGSAVKAGG